MGLSQIKTRVKAHLPEKAVAPDKGAAAFSHSTAFQAIPAIKMFPGISRQKQIKQTGKNNILAKSHYFCSGLAKHPPANVVLTEGHKNSLIQLWEVAA